MYKRDLITAEIEKLAKVLARIIGLKVELKLEEAQDLLAETLANNFGLPINILYDPELGPFELWLDKADLPAEKLDMLSQFIFNELELQHQTINNRVLSQKLNLIYQTLASKHHIVHLIHLDRQQLIKQYL